MKRLYFVLLLLSIGILAQAQTDTTANKTTFSFGGYVKADYLNTWYANGDVSETSPM